MSYQERKSAVSLLSNLLIFAFYYGVVYQMQHENRLNTEDTIRFLCYAILILLPVLIVGKLVVHIVFTLINALLKYEKEPAFTDELDKLIELKSVRNFCFVFMAGFFTAIGTVLLGMSYPVLFHMLLFTIILAGITIDLSQLYFYRRGIR